MSRRSFGTRKLRFEPLEPRELLSVTEKDPAAADGLYTIFADAATDVVDICIDSDKVYVSTDGNDGNAAELTSNNTVKDLVIILSNGPTVTFHSQKVGTDAGLASALFDLTGNLTIQGSSGAKDTVTFKDDANLGSASIGGDLTFTGQGGGDAFTIEPPPTPSQSTWVFGDLTINTGNDTTAAQVAIDTLVMKGGAGTSISLSTGSGPDTITLANTLTQGADLILLSDPGASTPGGDDTVTLNGVDLAGGDVTVDTGAGGNNVALTNVDTGGGKLKLSTGAGADTIALDQVATSDGELVLLSDGGRHKPGGADNVTLENVNLGGGKLTMQTGAGDDRVDLVDQIMTTGDIFIDLGAGDDTLKVGGAAGATVQANHMWIRGKSGADRIVVTNVDTTRRLGIRTHVGNDVVRIGGTVKAGSIKTHLGAGNDTLRLVTSVDVPGPNNFDAIGGQGKRDKTVGETVLPARYRRQFRRFENRNR